MKLVHIVPICQNKHHVLESLKKSIFPVQKVYLVSCDNNLDGEIEDMEKTLKLVFEVDTIDVCRLDLVDIVDVLLKMINNETDAGNMVFLNSTDSPEILDFAFHVSAHISGCKLYTGIPSKDRKGIDEIMDVPVEPGRSTVDDRLKIIKIIHQEGDELESLDRLIHLFRVDDAEGQIE